MFSTVLTLAGIAAAMLGIGVMFLIYGMREDS